MTTLDAKNIYDIRVRVLTSIFPQISISFFDIQINYMAVFKFEKIDFNHKNLLMAMITRSTRRFDQKGQLEPIDWKFQLSRSPFLLFNFFSKCLHVNFS